MALEAARDKADEILSSIADGFYALDSEWRFVYFNDRAERHLHKSREDVTGRPLLEVFPQIEDSPVRARLRKAMAERVAVEFEEFSPTFLRWMFYSVYPTREGGISVYFRDISDHKRLESEVAAARIEAERANTAKSKFIAEASHDLRQPVQSLVLQMALAERQVADNPPRARNARQDADVAKRPEWASRRRSGPLASRRRRRGPAGGGRSRRSSSAASRTNIGRRPTGSVSPSGWRIANSGPKPIRSCSSARCAT